MEKAFGIIIGIKLLAIAFFVYLLVVYAKKMVGQLDDIKTKLDAINAGTAALQNMTVTES